MPTDCKKQRIEGRFVKGPKSLLWFAAVTSIVIGTWDRIQLNFASCMTVLFALNKDINLCKGV